MYGVKLSNFLRTYLIVQYTQNFLNDLRNSRFVFLVNTYNRLRIRIRENVSLSLELVVLSGQYARGAGSP